MKKINTRQSVQRKKSKLVKMMAKAICPVVLAAIAGLFPYSMPTVSADLVQDGTNWTVTTDGINPWTTRIGSGPTGPDDIILTVNAGAGVLLGDATAVSLRDRVTVDVYGYLENNGTGTIPSIYPDTGHNTLDVRSNSVVTIYDGGRIQNKGSNASSEAINVMGSGNTIYVQKGGLMQSNAGVAVWFQYLNYNGVNNTIDNAGTISTNNPQSIIGSSSSHGINFINRATGVINGNLDFGAYNMPSGNDNLTLEAGSVVNGTIDGKGGNDSLFLSGAGGTEDTLGSNLRNFNSITKLGQSKWTLSQGISTYGVDQFVHVDEGTLRLEGNNSAYSHNLTVNSQGLDDEATLEGKSGSLTNSIVNNGIVRFLDEATDGEKTYAGLITTDPAALNSSGGIVEITEGGTIKLTGANTYTGGTRVNNGTVAVSNISSLGTGAISLSDGSGTSGTLRLDAATTVTQDIISNAQSGSGDSVIDTNGHDVTSSGIISGGELTKKGAGTLTLAGENTHSGGTVITQGTVSASSNSNLGAANSSVVFDDSGSQNSTLQLTADVNLGNRNMELTSDGTIDTQGNNVQSGGVISGNGGLTKEGTGKLTLTGENTYSGGTDIAKGTLELAQDGNIQGDVSNNGTLLFNRNAEKTFAGLISGTGNVVQDGTGTTVLSNAGNSYAGGTKINGGTLAATNANVFGTGDVFVGELLTDSKGTLRLDGSFTITNDLCVNADKDSGNAVIDTNGNNVTVSGSIFGGELTKAGAGTLYLTDDIKVFDSGLVITEGKVSVSANKYLGSLTGGVVFNNVDPAGAAVILEITGDTDLLDRNFNLETDGVIRVTDQHKVALGGVISGDGGLTKEGTGKLTLTGANTYTGDTLIMDGGELELGNGTDLGTIQSHVMIVDGTLAFNHDRLGDNKYIFENDIQAADGTKIVQRGGGHTVLAGVNHIEGADIYIENGAIDVMGNGVRLVVNNIFIGNGQKGWLIANDDGDVEFGNRLWIGQNGILQVGAAEDAAAAGPGFVKAVNNPTGYIENLGTIVLNHTNNDGYVFDGDLGGGVQGTVDSKIEMLAGRTIFTRDSSANQGTTNLKGGTLVMQGTAANLGGTVNVFANTLLEGNGTVGKLNNTGTVAPGFTSDNTNFYDLNVSGDYIGNGGTLALDTTLGDDRSATDRLVIGGSSFGSTKVLVTNRDGLGAATVKGIQVVEVNGDSSDGDFVLESNFLDPQGRRAIVAGVYGYHLEQDAKDWYLRSSVLAGNPPKPVDYQPAVAIYEVYPQILMQLNSMSSMSQRVGNRFWTSGSACDTGCEDVRPCSPVSKLGNKTVEGGGLWFRTEGSFGKFDPARSSSGAFYDNDIVQVQLGRDYLLAQNSNSVWVGGLNYRYGHAKADIGSIAGYRGNIKSEGHGVGATLTNYWRNGFYLDLQSQFSWYDSDLKSYDLVDSATGLPYNYLSKGNNGFGYGVGFEIGRKLKLQNGWLAVPQLQLMYTGVSFSSFVDPLGVRASLSDGQGLIGRLGWGMHREKTWTSHRGDCRRLDFHGIANLYYDFLDGTEVCVDDHFIADMNEQLWGGLGLGATYNWRNDTRSIFTEAEYRSSFDNASDNNVVSVSVGFRTRF